jgi:cytochrome o ubiquinol oxidase subunit IV
MSELHDAPATGAGIDLAPGEERLDGSGVAQGARGYLIGLALATGLTIASFYFCFSGLIYGPAIPAALIALAVAQIGVHLVFFLHLTTGPDNTNNALALAFGVLIVSLVIGGSLWIMGHLNHEMPPLSRVMEMQR